MILQEGQIFLEHLRKAGGSYVLTITLDMLEYLEIEKPKEGEEIEIMIKADKGKHGRFIGFGKPKVGK